MNALVDSRNVTPMARLVATLAAAFETDPAVRWMYPDRDQYQRHFPDFVAAFGGKAFSTGTADFLPGKDCAALWLPPGVMPEDEAVMDVLQRSVREDRLPELAELFEQMAGFHPEQPHWYLPLMGVVPAARGRGCGSALLRRGLERCDEERLPAYLEATSPRNQALYERFGFQALGVMQTRSSPPIVPMLRPARG